MIFAVGHVVNYGEISGEIRYFTSEDDAFKYYMQEAIPYDGAKPMYLIDDVDNKESLRDIVVDTCIDLKN